MGLKPVPCEVEITESGWVASFPFQWKEYCNRRPTKEEIGQWLEHDLFKNIALVCGQVEDNKYFYVVEFESRRMYEIFYDDPPKILAQPTMVVKTPHGKIQVYYLTDTPINEKRMGNQDFFIIIHGDGDFVIASTSHKGEAI